MIELNIKCINDLTKNISTIIVSCKDTGRGIKAEYINKLFQKFERLEVEKNTTTEGTGLGLAITKALVEMMGGTINVQSQFGQGSLFVVNIPQKISRMSRPLTEANLVNATFKGKNYIKTDYKNKKVLIVDDNKLNIKVARKALQDFNLVLDECYDGQECLDKIKEGNEYDLILMDIMMPNMSGDSALEKLKENPNFNIPTIALTADAIAGAKEKYLAEGFTYNEVQEAEQAAYASADIAPERSVMSSTSRVDWSKNALSRSPASPARELITATTALLDRGGCDRRFYGKAFLNRQLRGGVGIL